MRIGYSTAMSFYIQRTVSPPLPLEQVAKYFTILYYLFYFTYLVIQPWAMMGKYGKRIPWKKHSVAIIFIFYFSFRDLVKRTTKHHVNKQNTTSNHHHQRLTMKGYWIKQNSKIKGFYYFLRRSRGSCCCLSQAFFILAGFSTFHHPFLLPAYSDIHFSFLRSAQWRIEVHAQLNATTCL